MCMNKQLGEKFDKMFETTRNENYTTKLTEN